MFTCLFGNLFQNHLVPMHISSVSMTQSASQGLLSNMSGPPGNGSLRSQSQQSLDQSFGSSDETKSNTLSAGLDTSFTDSTSSIPLKSKVLKANGCEINLTKYMLPGKHDSDEETDGISKTEVVHYTESLIEEFWDSAKEKWLHPRTGKYIHMQEAIDCGILCSEVIQVKQANGQTINLQKAINSGQINIHTGKTINLKTALTWPFHVALAKGLVKVNDNEPMQKCDMYTELGPGLVFLISQKEVLRETKILDKRLDQWVDIPKAVDAFIFDTEWGKVKDNMTGKWLTWNEAKETGLILDPRLGEQSSPSTEESFMLKDQDSHIVNIKHVTSEDGQKEYGGHILFNQNPQKIAAGRKHSTDLVEKPSISLAQRRSSIATIEKAKVTAFPMMLDEAIKQSLYNPVTNKLHNPSDKSNTPFEIALQKGMINKESLVRDPVSKDIISLQEAIDNRIIDPESGKMIDANEQAISLNFAFNIGLIMRSQSPLKLSLSEIVDEGLFDEELGTFLNPDNNDEIRFSEAITTGLIDKDSIRVRDTETGHVMKMDEALERGLMYFDSGVCVDMAKRERVPIIESLDRGILLDFANQPKMSLQAAVEENLFDAELCVFRDIDLGIDYTLGNALESGFLDADSILVRDPKTLTILAIDAAIHEQIIDPVSGSYVGSGMEIGFAEAIEKGLVLYNASHGMLPCSVIEAVRFSIYDPKTKKFVDPKTGKMLTLEKAIEERLIDPKMTMIKDTSTGRFLSLTNAEYLGVVNSKTAEVTMLKEDKQCDIKTAKETGILRRAASDECITLNKAIKKGLVDKEGQVYDTLSKKTLSLEDAILVRVINPIPTLVKDVRLDKFIPLHEAIEIGIIDTSVGLFKNTETNTMMSLLDAADSGYIIEIPSTGLTLAEAVQHGFYIENIGHFLDVRTGKQVNLKEAIDLRLIDASRKQIVVPGSGIFSLKDSFDLGYMDKDTGAYLQDDGHIGLQEAVEKFLVVTLGSKKRNKSMTESFCEDMESMKTWNDFVVKVPNEKTFLDMETAVEEGLIDMQTESYCDVKHDVIVPITTAIEAGLVVDATRPALGLASAYSHGLYDIQNNTVLNPADNSTVPLAEAIKIGLIDTNRTRVKDLKTGEYIPLKQALKKGIVSNKTGSILEQTQKKTFTLDVAVSEDLIVDFKKRSFTVPEGVKFGMISHDGLMVEDLNTGNFLSFDDAVERGVIDKFNTAVVQVGDEDDENAMPSQMSLAEAIDQKILDENSGALKVRGRRMSLMEAVNKSFIVEKRDVKVSPSMDSSGLGQSSLFDGSELTELQRSIENELKLQEQKKSLADVDLTSSFMSDRSDSVSSPIRFDEALKFGFLNLETGEFTDYLMDEKMTIAEAASKGRLSIKRVMYHDTERQMMLPLKDALEQKLLFQVSNKLNQGSSDSLRKPITFNEAINKGLLVIKSQPLSAMLGTDDDISVKSDTFSEMVMKNKNLEWLAPTKNISSSLDSLIKNVKDDQSGYRIGTLFDSIEKGVFDGKEGVLTDKFTEKKMKINEAIACGLINSKAREIVDAGTDECITLEEAIHRKIIDVEKGVYVDPLSGCAMSLVSAKDTGYIVKSKDTLHSKSSVEIYVEEILRNEDGKGKSRLQDAFSSGVLSRSKTEVIDPDTVKPVTLKRAGSLGMIDTNTGEFRNPHTGESCSLSEAVEKGFILSPKGLSLYSAVNQGLYNEETGQFKSAANDSELTLRAMIDTDVITDSCREIRDITNDCDLIKLKEGIKRKIIDDVGGKYVSSTTNLNFKEAVSAGLIISNIPREGLRESSNSVETITGIKPDSIWKGNLRKHDIVADGPTMVLRQGKHNGMADSKVTSSISSMDTNSSGYETIHSATHQPQEDGIMFSVKLDKIKGEQPYFDMTDKDMFDFETYEKESKESGDGPEQLPQELKNETDEHKIGESPDDKKVHTSKKKSNGLIEKSTTPLSNVPHIEIHGVNEPLPGVGGGLGVKVSISPVRSKEFVFSPGPPQSLTVERQVLMCLVPDCLHWLSPPLI